MADSALEKSSTQQTQQIHGSKLIPSICKPSGFQHVSSRGMCCRDPLSMVSHQVTFGRFAMRTLDVVKRHSKHRFNNKNLMILMYMTGWGKKKLVCWNGDPKLSSFWLDHSFRKSPMMITSAPDIRPWPPAAPEVSRACAALCTLHCGTAGTRTAALARRSGRPQPLELQDLQGPQNAVPLFANWNITRVLPIIHSHSSFIFHHHHHLLLLLLILHHHHHPRHCHCPLCLMF